MYCGTYCGRWLLFHQYLVITLICYNALDMISVSCLSEFASHISLDTNLRLKLNNHSEETPNLLAISRKLFWSFRRQLVRRCICTLEPRHHLNSRYSFYLSESTAPVRSEDLMHFLIFNHVKSIFAGTPNSFIISLLDISLQMYRKYYNVLICHWTCC